MTLAYAADLGLKVRVTDISAQKIDGSLLATYNMVIAVFQVVNKLGRFWFFQETFLLANISMKVVLGMLFLILNNADVQFAQKELTWKTYTTKKTLPTTHQIEIINWKKFAKAALNKKVEAFGMHIRSLELRMNIDLAKKALTLLLTEKVTVPTEYLDFANVFLRKLANVPPERTSANEHAIKLKKGNQPPYGPIYSLEPVELETLKTYIETNLANNFIQGSKSLANTLILFVHKPNGSLCLYVNYQGLNNLTIKNWYLLPLIVESLDWLD